MNAPTILKYLEMLANHNLAVNMAMHLVVLAALAAVLVVKGTSLRRILFQASICILFASVAIQAVIFGNPFHAVTFGILGVAAIVHLVLNKDDIRTNGRKLQTGMALFSIIIGLWYPEFVKTNALALLALSPVGIIPCPTLLVSIGLITLTYCGSGRLQYGLTIFMGLVYGVIGTFVLGVYLDITLLIMAVFALYVFLSRRSIEN